MTFLRARARPIPGFVQGLVQDAEPNILPLGAIAEGENFIALPAGTQKIRGGSRIVQTLHDDAAPVFQAAGTAVSGTGPVTPTWPTHVAGDVALLVVQSDNEAITLSTASGFVEVADSPQGTGAGVGGTRLALFWCRATTAAQAAPVVADPGDHVLAQIFTFRRCIASGDPWDVTAGDVEAASVAAVSIPGDTTTVATCLVVVIVANATDDVTQQVPSFTNADLADLARLGGTNITDGTGGGFDVGAGVKVAAGAYGATTATLDSASAQGRLSVALKGTGTAGDVTQVPLVWPFTPVGAVALSWSAVKAKHYATRLTTDMAFVTGSEATSQVDLTASPSTAWDNATDPARPVAAELFEKFFIADATIDQTTRNTFLSLDSSGTVLEPQFAFAGGSPASLLPYCLEEYNGVLFLAGYGDEGDTDRPEIVRHSFLARSPDDVTGGAEGFDQDAYVLIGAKGQRVTAMRKGRGLLLVAKAHEFYRITGFGRAYPGWQYTVENVQNTLGLGIANPLALTFAEGFWYGVGPQGPLRTDGFAVESLTGPRQRGWRGIDQPENAWVAYHPERRVILFGVHPFEASTGRSDTYPWVIWVWDLERSVWQTDWKFGADFFMAAAVTVGIGESGGATGPTAPPADLVISAETTSGYQADWTNGDATAQTEYWEKEETGGTWALITTLDPGVAQYVRTGRTPHTTYYVRIRHRKSGVTTVYTDEVPAQTLIAAPSLADGGPIDETGTPVRLLITSTNHGLVTVRLNRNGVDDYVDYPNVAEGTFIHLADAATYKAKATDAGWPSTDSGFGNTVVIS